jgi:phosphopantothenoylcysteine synthetase/decarboxylase
MSAPFAGRRLCLVACGAGPAADAVRLIDAAQGRGWKVDVIATPAGVGFLNTAAIEAATGTEVRSEYRSPSPALARELPGYAACIVAPATFNTINKLALGISDTYALGSIAEAVGRRIPVTLVPFVNTALAARAPFLRSVDQLRDEGARILLGEDYGWVPHRPGTGGTQASLFPWLTALDVTEAAVIAMETGQP